MVPSRAGCVQRAISTPSRNTLQLRSCKTARNHFLHRHYIRYSSHVVRAGLIQEINEEELEVEVANRDRPIIIDFFATWCGPCVLLAKELEQVAEQLGDSIKILKVDCDKNEGISSALQIQGLPTLIFVGMDPSKPALRTEGLLPAQAIIDIVQKDLLSTE